jgi:SAM-dependent methyltransferase
MSNVSLGLKNWMAEHLPVPFHLLVKLINGKTVPAQSRSDVWVKSLIESRTNPKDHILNIGLDDGNVATPSLKNSAGKKIDVIFVFATLQKTVHRRKYMTEIRQLLQPGGRAFILVPDNCLGPNESAENCLKYSESSLRWFLGRYFDVLSVEPITEPNHRSPLLLATCQRVERTAGFWDLISRQRKF